MKTVSEMIKLECDLLSEFLIEKNTRYGNSVIQPLRIFSKAPADEQINVRLDDKLSRIMTSVPGDTEDAEGDLLGYLMMKRVFKRFHGEQINEQ